jgi:hypothetical protein
MAGPTIDHMVSITVLVAALMLTFGLYNQLLASAFAYQRNHQVVMKAVDLMNTICLSPGNPTDWGQNNSTPLSFGLQNPESAGYTLSPYSIMRLRSSVDGQLVYYPKTDSYYNNVSLDGGGSLLMPVSDCINYTTAARLLGVNGSYGFQISITPTLNVSVSQVPASYLILKVQVRGPGLPLSGASLNYHMHQVVANPDPEYDEFPLILTQSGVAQTDSAGSASIEFPSIDDSDDAYSFIAYAHLGGLNGVGYYSHDVLDDKPQFIIPFIEDFEQGIIIIAHNWDVHDFGPPVPAVHYNATFFVLTEDFELCPVEIENSTGKVNYGEGEPYNTTQVPASESGILFISYRWGNRFGTVMVPWGISTLGVSVTFGGDPSGHSFVATELRQVTVNEMSYQVKLAVWRED